MPASLQQPPRWSKKTDQLVRHVALKCRPRFQSELGHWIESRPLFAAFLTTNQDKVRKKLNTSEGEEARLDVRAELLVAYLILADRRFEVAFEAYGTGQRGPDLSVTYRTNQRFNLEVTRLRASAGTDAANDVASEVGRLANVIAGKVRQLPADVPNGLLIAARGLWIAEDDMAAAVRLLKTHAERKDDTFFTRRGLKDARDFHTRFLNLGGVLVLDESSSPARVVSFSNRAARHPLPNEALTRLLNCLSG
jgi:hypothetical protein